MCAYEEIKAKPSPDATTNNDSISEDKAPDEYKNQKQAFLKEWITTLSADRLLRDKYSFKAYKIVKKSLWGWAILLAIYGLIKLLTRNENNGHGFEIFSDAVLIAITSATTLNIFAAFLSLVKGLFPSINTDKK